MVRPRSCRVIYYFDTPALGIRHILFDRVTSTKFRCFGYNKHPRPMLCGLGCPPSPCNLDLASAKSRHLRSGKHATLMLLWAWLTPIPGVLDLANMPDSCIWV